MINFTQIYTNFDHAINNLKVILDQSDRPEAEEYRKQLQIETKALRENPILRVAFVGQYSAGKSTIISALTGNRKIKTGSGITTDKATPYSWNGIEIMDTPGIGTERQDHDNVTYKAIEQADLLIFCTTHMLLDNHIIKHFRKLAYEKRYGDKIMLVFNKLSAEAGNDDQKIANYRASMIKALHPYNLDEFSVCFFDAKDYCEGVDEDDKELIEISRFPDFIKALNQFVQERDKLAQLSSPIRRVRGYTEEIESWFCDTSAQNEPFLEVLTRLTRRIREERHKLALEVRRLSLNAGSVIRTFGSDFANDIPEFTSQIEINNRQKELEIGILEVYTQSEKDFNKAIENSVKSLQDDVTEILKSNLVSDFIATFESETELQSKSASKGWDFENMTNQARFLGEFGRDIGIKVSQKAIGPLGGLSTGSLGAAGSDAHKAILIIGKSIGFKFRPWQAVSFAKNIGNVAKFAGPVLGILTIVGEIWTAYDKSKREREMREAQGQIDLEFAQIALNLELQFKEQQQEFESQTFDNLEMKIRSEREEYHNAKTGNNEQIGKLRRVQQQLDTLIQSLRY